MNRSGLIIGAGLALAVALAVGGLVQQRGHSGRPLATVVVTLLLLLLPYFLFGLTNLDQWLKHWLSHRPTRLFLPGALLLGTYVLYGVGTETFALRSLLKLTLFISLPTCVLFFAHRANPQLAWQDAVAILAIWLPFDFRWLRDIWTWPEGLGAYVINTILAVDLAVVLFVAFRRLEGVGYHFDLRRADIGVIGVNFLIFAAIAIPLGLATGFLTFNPQLDGFGSLGSLVGLFLFVGWPEELLFRGLIQNFLQKRLGSDRQALILAALIFGAAHLNTGDWRYFLLASIAGLFYGRAYLQSGGLLAPACVHTLVDAVWGALF